MINDNAYKLDLSTAYGDRFDSRMNPFEEGGDDRDLTNKAKDPLRDIGGSLTNPKTNMMKQSLQDLSMEKYEKFDSWWKNGKSRLGSCSLITLVLPKLG
ncbi:hypothetical protein CR513_08963, partial [Mucuna pruriens]